MLKRKKLAKIRREKELKDRIESDKKFKEKRTKELEKRRIVAKEARKEAFDKYCATFMDGIDKHTAQPSWSEGHAFKKRNILNNY